MSQYWQLPSLTASPRCDLRKSIYGRDLAFPRRLRPTCSNLSCFLSVTAQNSPSLKPSSQTITMHFSHVAALTMLLGSAIAVPRHQSKFAKWRLTGSNMVSEECGHGQILHPGLQNCVDVPESIGKSPSQLFYQDILLI